jgi:hypothetical protein
VGYATNIFALVDTKNYQNIYKTKNLKSNILGILPKNAQNIGYKNNRYLNIDINNPSIKNGTWYRISFYSLNKRQIIHGWIRNSANIGMFALSNDIVKKSSVVLYKVIKHKKNEFLNVRVGPGSKYDIIDRLAYNQKNIIVKSKRKSKKGGEWCWINYDNISNSNEVNQKVNYIDREGWVFCKYISAYDKKDISKAKQDKNSNITLKPMVQKAVNSLDNSLSISSDMKYIAIVNNKKILLYHYKSGKEISYLDEITSTSTSDDIATAFSLNGDKILIAYRNANDIKLSICEWDYLNTKKCAFKIDTNIDISYILKILPLNDKRFQIITPNRQIVYDIQNHKVVSDTEIDCGDNDYKIRDISNDLSIDAYVNKYKNDGWGSLYIDDLNMHRHIKELNIPAKSYNILRISNDKKKILLQLRKSHKILFCDIQSKVCKTYNVKAPEFYDAKFSKDDKHLIVVSEDKILSYRTSDFRLIKSISFLKDNNRCVIKYSTEKDIVTQICEDGSIGKWDLKNIIYKQDNTINISQYCKDDYITYFDILPNSNYLYICLSGEILSIKASYNINVTKKIDFEFGQIDIDENYLYYTGSDRLYQFDLKQNKIIKKTKFDLNVQSLDAQSSQLLIGTLMGDILIWDNNRINYLVNSQECAVKNIKYIENGHTLYSCNNQINLIDISRNREIHKFLGHTDAIAALTLIEDNQHFLSASNDGTIKLWDIGKTWFDKEYIGHTSTVDSVSMIKKNYIISKDCENNIKIWNYNNTKEMATLRKIDNDWIVITPEGYFTGSKGIIKYLSIVKHTKHGMEPFDFYQLYDHFFRPDLVKLKLSGDEEAYQKAIAGMTYEEALKNPPPKLTFESVGNQKVKMSDFEYVPVKTKKSKIKLTFSVKENEEGGGVGLIRVYQEGKLVRTIGEGKIHKQAANIDTLVEQETLDKKAKEKQKYYLAALSKAVSSDIDMDVEETIAAVEEDNTSNHEGNYTIELELKSGNNDISIEAFNRTNTVTSYRENITVNAAIPEKKPKLYAIVAGVNTFEAPSVSNLKYSQNDAKAIKEAIESKTKTLFDEVEVVYLTGEKVTKANILAAAQKIKKKAKLTDTVLFYISTHGRAARGKFYLVPYNNKSVKDWIDFEETFYAIQSSKALNQIFIIDACESGKANDIVSSVYDSRASVLAKSSGVHMLLATTRGTYAFESQDKNVKNSVFTHKILQALKDTKTDKNQDHVISVIELSDKLKEDPDNNSYQYPVIRNVGKDVGLEKVE